MGGMGGGNFGQRGAMPPDALQVSGMWMCHCHSPSLSVLYECFREGA